MSRTHGLFLKNDQHKIPDLLSLLTTFYVKVDFFQRLTFWPSLTLEKGQKEQHDFFKNWHTRSRYQKASSLQISSKSHRGAYSLQIVRDPESNGKENSKIQSTKCKTKHPFTLILHPPKFYLHIL